MLLLVVELQPSTQQERGHTLAPRWHTAALVGLILAVAITGSVMTRHAPIAVSSTKALISSAYLPTILAQGMLAIYVCRIGRPRNALSWLVGRRWETVARACGDLALALGCFVVIEASDALWVSCVSHGHAASTYAVLPHTPVERLIWVFVSLSVGVSEEIVYRGYLQTQLAAFSGHAVAGVFLQATLFGIAHAQQGAAAIARVGFYGLVFGALAQWRGSLLPGMMCHVAIDVVSGV